MIEWIEKKQVSFKESCDVVLKVHEDRKGKRTIFTFYKGMIKKCTGGAFIRIGQDKTRLYFCEGNSTQGYTVQTTSIDGQTATFRVSYSILPITSKEIGKYKLEYDKDQKMWYIDALHKLGIEWLDKRKEQKK